MKKQFRGMAVKKLLSILMISLMGFNNAMSLEIISTSISSGNTEGGYDITITTDNFLTNPNASIGSNVCAVTSFSNFDLTCTVPPGTGSVPIYVNDNDINSDPYFSLFNYNAPIINAINPITLNRVGGDTITIVGSNFGISNAQVFIAGQSCTNVNHSPITPHEEISCTSPPGNNKQATVQVIQSGGISSQFSSVAYIQCQAGFFEDGNNCLPCPPGRYQDAVAQTFCKVCPVGTFANDVGSTSCEKCEAGTIQDSTGQITCIDCAAGTFQNLEGQTSCKLCAAGTASNKVKAINCPSCSIGRFQDKVGQTNCNDCNPGTFQDETGQTACKLCQAGTAVDVFGAESCVSCGFGEFQDNVGQTSCIECEAGTFQNFTGQLSCNTCSPGTFTENDGAKECQACDAGFFQNNVGQTSCLACSPGSFNNNTGASQCTDCPIQSFQDLSGQTFCLTCPNGTTQPNSGQAECLGTGQCDIFYGLFQSNFESGNEPVID